MFRNGIHFKIVSLVVILTALGAGVAIYFGVKMKEADLLDEKLQASRLVAEPVLTAIYEDMIEERADLVRYMLRDLGTAHGLGSISIVRSNGVEEAFRDMKTINEVIKVRGTARPEWLAGHVNEARNVAAGVYSPEFKAALERYRRDWGAGPVNYIERADGTPYFVYLQPIETRFKCKTCHAGDGARGVLVIRMPLEQMYASLAKESARWIFAGIMGTFISGVFLSVVMRKTVTGPIDRNLKAIKATVVGGPGGRLETGSGDDIGGMFAAFNEMLDTVNRRGDEKMRLLETAASDRETLQWAFDAMQEMISIHDMDGKAFKVNKALAARLKTTPEALAGKSCHEIFFDRKGPHAGCPHEKTVLTAAAASGEFTDMALDGAYQVTTLPVLNASGAMIAVIHVARNLTADKLLRDQLIQAAKLSCVGRLAGGIAHELNNPLMGIMGFAQLVIDKPGDAPVSEVRDKILKIYSESQKASRIVQNLLAFASTKRSERELQEINEIVRQAANLREYAMKANNIAVALDFEPGIPATMLDRYQIQQAVLNILGNAEDAIVSTNRSGKIEIRTRYRRGNVEISVRDDGPGIPNELIMKVFDPFFTTKDVGKGTGLGLSTAYGIVAEHGGVINIFNRDEGGAVVEMVLPVINALQWSEIQKAVDEAEVHLRSLKRRRAIIIDGGATSAALGDILVKEGFSCVSISGAPAALDALKDGSYALVLIDLAMAARDNRRLYDIIVARHEYLKDRIIAVTDGQGSIEARLFLEATGCPHISRPVDPKELAALVRVLLV